MNSSEKLSALFAAVERSGVYVFSGSTATIEKAGRAAGLALFSLDLGSLEGKAPLLDSLASHLKFPKHFGYNWDALHDILTDSSWHPANGWIIIFHSAHQFEATHKKEFETLIEVCKSSIEHWRRNGKPFWVLVQGAGKWNSGLATFPSA